MDNNQLLTPNTLIPLSQTILGINNQQSKDISSGYNVMNSDLTKSYGNVLIDEQDRVFNVNNVGVATWYPSSDIYTNTSGKRGMAGTGNLDNDYPNMQHIPYVLNPNNINGYDPKSQLYFNGSVRNKQSSGDEMKNVFAGLKSSIDFEYKGCVVSPSINDSSNLINMDFNIVEATYGANCGQPAGNITDRSKIYIHGGTTPYTMSDPAYYFGDPSPGCNKELSITYDCNGERKTQSGYYDSSGSLDITCQPKSSISRCYSLAESNNADYFGLGNLDKDTQLGTCYISKDTAFLNRKWTNPGTPLWSISVSDLSNTNQAVNMSVYVGLNGNLFFNENTDYNDTYSLYSFCNANKLPGCTPGGGSAFQYDGSKYTCSSCLFLANDGNLYIFRFCAEPGGSVTIPSDIMQNPANYFQFLIYSSQTSSMPLYRGWDDQEIASGVSGNIFYSKANPALTYGQSIYSLDGRLRLTFENDNLHNKLTLYTGDPTKSGCSQSMGSDVWNGIDGVAMNYIKQQADNVDNALGKLAYVNRLGTAYEYTDDELFGYSDKYTINPGFTVKSIDTVSYAKKVNDNNIYDNGSSSIDLCQQNCTNSNTCRGAVIDNNSCYLLDTINNTDLVYKMGGENSITTVSNTAPSYTKYTNNMLYGFDLPGSGTTFDTPEKCLDFCNSTDGCEGVQYGRLGGNCWTKSSEGTSDLSHLATIDDNDVYIRDKEAKPYTKYPNTGLWGYVAPGETTDGQMFDTAEKCIDHCSSIDGCTGVEYWYNGNCWTKSSEGTSDLSHLAPSSGGDVYIQDKQTPQTYSQYANKVLNGFDLPGSGSIFNTIEKCLDFCNSTDGCRGVQYDRNAGNCFTKSSEGTSDLNHMSTNDNNDVYINSSSASAQPPNLMLRLPSIKKVGEPDTTISYTKYPQQGLGGYDLPDINGQYETAEQCLDLCNNKSGCTGVEYWYSINGGNCWTKTSEGTSDLNHLAPSTNGDVYIRNKPSVNKTGVSYLISSDINVINTDKYSNYNISNNPMSPDITDVALMPNSITSNFDSSNKALEKVNKTIVGETYRIIKESFGNRQTIYTDNNDKIGGIDNAISGYLSGKPSIMAQTITMNKMMSNSLLEMNHLNVIYTCLFILAGILLIIAFSISL